MKVAGLHGKISQLTYILVKVQNDTVPSSVNSCEVDPEYLCTRDPHNGQEKAG